MIDPGARRELGVFATAYLTYFGVRAVTEGHVDVALANADSLMRIERTLGIAWEHDLQAFVVDSDTLTGLADAVYIYGHWPLLISTGVVLYRFRRDRYYTLRDGCLLTGTVGLLIFALFPVAPPRLTDLPVLDTVTIRSPGYRRLLPPSLVNELAAMPSFHVGWNLLAGIVIFGSTRNPLWRAFAVLMPAAMGFAVIATANHFVIDVVVGVAIVLTALPVVQRWHGARSLTRRQRLYRRVCAAL